MKEEIIDIGNTVVCDICNDDYTNSDVCGGFLIGSWGYCPKCAEKSSAEPSEITMICPLSMPFREFILLARNGNNTIKIRSFDKDEKMF